MNRASKVNSFSVMESTLQMYGAEKYLPIFKKYGIDTQTLGLLNEEDLKSIGIDDEELPSKIVSQCKNLPKRKDNSKLYEVNDEYVTIILKDIYEHLRLLHPSVSVWLNRTNIQLSDIKLRPSMECFMATNELFEKELQTFDSTFFTGYKKPCKWQYVLAVIITSTASLYTLKKYFSL